MQQLEKMMLRKTGGLPKTGADILIAGCMKDHYFKRIPKDTVPTIVFKRCYIENMQEKHIWIKYMTIITT